MSLPPQPGPPERRALIPLAAVLLALAVIAVGLIVVVGVPSGTGERPSTSATARRDAGEQRAGGEREPGGQALGGEHVREATPGAEEGGERVSAASELLAQNAYPRSYVAARQELTSRAATQALPAGLTAGDFRPKVNATGLRGQAGAAWALVGPVGVTRPEGSPSAPVVGGRVTAMVIDPACGTAGHGCRMWMAAAGGGVWRTPDAMAATPQWTFVSGDIPGTSMGSLALDPNDATGNTIYAGTGEPNGSDSEAGVGLYKSTDGGDTWSLVPGSRAYAMDRSIGSIAISPGHPDIIRIGTGIGEHGNGVVPGGGSPPPNAPPLGMYVSANGGAAFWSELSPMQPAAGSATSQVGSVVQIEFDPTDPSIIYVSVMGSGIWRRASGAWTRIYTPQDPAVESREAFTLIAHGATVHMYVLEGAPTGAANGGIVRRTLDAQAATPSWSLLSNPAMSSNLFGASTLCGNQCFYDVSMAGSANGVHDVVWVGGSMQYSEIIGFDPGAQATWGVSNGRAVVRSANAEAATNAVTWTDMTVGATTGANVGSHPDQHAIALNPSNPDQAFLASDGGLVRTDGGFTDASSQCASRPNAGNATLLARCQQLLSAIPTAVVGLNSGLSTLQVQGLATTTASPGTLMAGFQDNGTAMNGGGATWTGVAAGDGGQPAFDLSGPGIAYQQYFSGVLSVSYDPLTQASYMPIYAPMAIAQNTTGEQVAFYAPLLTDPVTEGTVFTGWSHVWRSTDSGGDPDTLAALGCAQTLVVGCGDFEPMGPDLAGGAGNYVSAIARTPADTNTLWAATAQGTLFVTKNATADSASVAFTRIDDDAPATPARFVSAIAVDPSDANHAWVSYAGYNAYTPSTPGHLFEVRFDPATGTATWADRSYDLGDVPLRAMTYDPLLGDIYASGDWGVLRLPGGATSWMDAGSSMPQVPTFELDIQPAQRVLYAGTHGRGTYSLALPDASPGPAPAAPMPAASASAPAAPGPVTVRILSKGTQIGVGTTGKVRIRVAAVAAPGAGTVTLNGGLQPRERRPATVRLAKSRFGFGANTRTTVVVTLPSGSRRALGVAGRMYVNAVVNMTPTGGPTTSATSRVLLVASPALRRASR